MTAGRVVVRRVLVEPLVWPVTVGVVFVLAEYGAGVAFVVDQHPVSALGSDAADEPFGVAVRPRRPRRCLHHVDTFRREHRVEGCGELRIPVADDEPERRDPITQVHDHVAGLLGRPVGRWVGADTEDVDPPGRDLHHEQHVQPS
jgi:hypothetical protein